MPPEPLEFGDTRSRGPTSACRARAQTVPSLDSRSVDDGPTQVARHPMGDIFQRALSDCPSDAVRLRRAVSTGREVKRVAVNLMCRRHELGDLV
jgi:hypothetical protein